MSSDAINDEILAIKRQLAAQFDNNLDRIVADLQSRQQNTVRLPPRKLPPNSNDMPALPTVGYPNGSSPPTVG